MGQRVKFRSLDVAHEVAFLDLPNPGLRGHPTSHAGKQKRDGRKEGGWNAEAVTISRVRRGAAPNPFRTSGGGGGSAYGKGRKKTSLEPRQHLTATAKEGGRLEPGKRGGPKRTPGRGPGAQILGHGFLWKPGTPSFCSVLGPSHPRACLSLHTTLPAFCLQSLRKAFTLAATATREAEVELPSRDIYHLHPTVPLQGPRTARLGPCLSHAASVSWCTGHANLLIKHGREADTGARENSLPVKGPGGDSRSSWQNLGSKSQRSMARSGWGRNLGGVQRAAAERRCGRSPGRQGQALGKAQYAKGLGSCFF